MSAENISVDVLNIGRAVQAELQRVIYGQAVAIQSLLVAVAAGGHVLIEGVPGVAKTLLARSLAAALRCRFSRIQFTPDLMPSDITGVNVFDSKTNEFRFSPGPLFADIVLADEINRAPAKTQAALLEAMQDYQVSIDGQSHQLSNWLHGGRHGKPDRIRGHLSAPGGATGPLPNESRRRLSRRGRRTGDAQIEPRLWAKIGAAPQRHPTGHRSGRNRSTARRDPRRPGR